MSELESPLETGMISAKPKTAAEFEMPDEQPFVESETATPNTSIGADKYAAFGLSVLMFVLIIGLSIWYAIIAVDEGSVDMITETNRQIPIENKQRCGQLVDAPPSYEYNTPMVLAALGFGALVVFVLGFVFLHSVSESFNVDKSGIATYLLGFCMFFVAVFSSAYVGASRNAKPYKVCPDTAARYNTSYYKLAYNSQYAMIAFAVIGIIAAIYASFDSS